jgi:GPH family glycoside/pentoside/hexuronide:cation symporter
MAAFYVTPPDQYWLMVAINCIGTFVIGPTPALVWAMYADTADYGEWKTGRRTTALVFSSLQFAQKLGLAPVHIQRHPGRTGATRHCLDFLLQD